MTSAIEPTDVVVASSSEDAAAVEAVRQHHAELATRLAGHVDRLLAAGGQAREGFDSARRATVTFCTTELLPHAAAEERSLYAAAAASERASLLVDAMIAEHRLLLRLVEEVRDATEPLRAAASGYALRVLFESHLGKENDLVLPIVAADPAVSLADVLSGMHELLGGPAEHGDTHSHAGKHGHPDEHGQGLGGCGCGATDEVDIPELDVRDVPHAIRHATVFGAFDAIPAGGSLVLVAPHDPVPLLRQLSARAGGALDVSYAERGPDAWRLRLTRAR